MSASGDGRIEVRAHFTLQRGDDEAAYTAVIELIDQLNRVANLPQCEADLRIAVDGPSDAPESVAAASGEHREGARDPDGGTDPPAAIV
ncbi:MAG: hypothetical protein ACYDA6_10960 [Solirubrobacteraceae bacterium]